jgi:2-haloacid dehalogenase
MTTASVLKLFIFKVHLVIPSGKSRHFQAHLLSLTQVNGRHTRSRRCFSRRVACGLIACRRYATQRAGSRFTEQEADMTARTFVFDAYGTLFDVHAAISHHRAACGPDADRMSEMWRTKQLEYTWTLTLSGQYQDFWTLTERALDYSLARVPSADSAIRSKLLDAYFALDAFPDARRALEELKKRGDRTAILSNGSPKMLSGAVEGAKIGHLLDKVLSVDAIRMYKPRREVYAMATEAFGNTPDDITFVSSNRWDVMGAVVCGFHGVWVNRSKMPNEFPEHRPQSILPDLASLPSLAV